MMMAVNYHQLSECFERWMLLHLDGETVEFSAAMDGKRIAQKVDSNDGKERFVGLVSLFALEQGVTLKLAALSEQASREILVVQTLLETLQLDRLIISMDALHTPKKH
jgi:hypothetical protein